MDAFTAVCVAFAFSATAILLLRPLCVRWGHVDRPGGRKSHDLATPLCGGLAITVSIVGLGLGTLPSWQFAGFAFGIVVLLVLGALDDRRHVPATIRLAMQTIAVVVGMCYMGDVYLQNLGALVGGDDIDLAQFAIAFTVFGAVGLINAVNMIDGMDGLAGGFSVMVVTLILGLAAGTSAVNIVLLCLTIGSLMGFLAFNLRTPWQRHARIFLGDAGSLVLGYILAWFAIQGSQGHDAVIDPITAVWLFGLPLVDTGYLMGSRVLRGQSPLKADRYHFHHLLQRCGMTPGWALYLWLFVAGCFMALGMVAQFAGVSETMRLLVFLGVFAVYCVLLSGVWRRLDEGERREVARAP